MSGETEATPDRKIKTEAIVRAQHDGIKVEIDLTQEYLDHVCANVDPNWVAFALLQNEQTREIILDVLMGKTFMQLSTGPQSFDDEFRAQLIDKAARKNYGNLARKMMSAIVVAEKYTRAYWDWFHNGKPMLGNGWNGESRPDVKGPEFFEHSEDPAHAWDRVRKEIEATVMAAIADPIEAAIAVDVPAKDTE